MLPKSKKKIKYKNSLQSVPSLHWLCMQSRGWWRRAFISNKNHAHLLQAGTKGTITAAGRRVCSSPTCYVNTLILPPRRLPARPGICCEIRRRFARRILATGRLISFRRKKLKISFFIPSWRRCDTWLEGRRCIFCPICNPVSHALVPAHHRVRHDS